MKRLILLFLVLSSFIGLAQETKSQLTTRFDVIRNAGTGQNTAARIANAYQENADGSIGIYPVTLTGTGTYTGSLIGLDAYTGRIVFATFSSTNSGSATANLNSIGATTIQKDVSGTWTNLSASDLVAGKLYRLYNDGTRWQIDLGGAGGGGGASAFTDLTDVPASYSGQGLKAVRVNTGETALEFYTPSVGSGTVTDVSVTTANGVSGSVATSTTTPAITLTLGAITPSSVAASGTVTGSNLSGTNTGDQTTVTGNAGTATTLQTSRNIQGVAFNGSADINPINGTGFVKSTGTTLSYDNSTYLTTSSAASSYQPLDADLTTIAGLTATTDNFMVANASAWASRTPAQAKTSLSLNNVENTALSTWAGSSNITTTGTISTGTWSGTAIAIAKGGTGLTSLGTAFQGLQVNSGATALEYYTRTSNPMTTVGDLLIGGTSGVPARLADVATTNVLLSGGVATAPSWGKVDLTNAVSGDLPFANLTQGTALSVLGVTGNSTADVASIVGTAGQALQVNSAGTALTFAAMLGLSSKLADFISDVSNTSTTETDLFSYTSPANTLSTNGDEMHFHLSGTFTDAGATCQIRFYYAGTNAGNTTALTLTGTGSWAADFYVVKTGSTTARAYCTFVTTASATTTYTLETDLTGITFSNTNIIKVTGTAPGGTGGTGDIVAKVGKIIKNPAAGN